MKEIETDVAGMIMFDSNLRPFIPLGSTNSLKNPDFPIPISIMFGEFDWMQGVD
jgi:hypothetical protein